MKSIGLVVMCGFLSIGLLSPSFCSAQEKDKRVNLDDVVVSATRTEKEVDIAPASATIINREDLDRLNFHRLDDAIRYEAGVFQGKLRGLPSGSQTLVMLNGMPLNSGWFGGLRWNNIAMENVERIEIVRGPGSALYGGNAMGGTINVVTKIPEAFEAGIGARFGSDDNRTYTGYVGDRIGEKVGLRLGFEIDEELSGYPTRYVQRTLRSGDGDLTGGFPMKTRTDKDAWIAGDQGDRNEEQWSANLTAAYDVTDTGSFQLNAQVSEETYDYGPPHSYISDAGGNEVFNGRINAGVGQYASISDKNYLTGAADTLNQSYMVTYTENFGPTAFIGKVGYQHEDKWYTTPSAQNVETYADAQGNVKEFDTDTYFTDLQVSFAAGDKNTITTGVYGRYNDFTQGRYELSYYRDEESKTTGKTESTQGKDEYLAFYLQDEYKAIENTLTAYLGARFDYWKAHDGRSGSTEDPTILEDVNNSAISPKLSLVWTLAEDTVVKGSVGQAFRAPTIYDLYRTYNSSATRTVFSNPDLDPETILNYEIGFVQYFNQKMFKLGSTAFYSEIEDLIYSYDGDDGNSYKDNAGEARIQGVELMFSAIPWDFLMLWANYTYNDTEITKQAKDPEMEGKKITGMPDQIINVGVDLMYEWFKTSLTGQYVGQIYKTKYNTDIPDVYKANSKVWLWQAKLTGDMPWKSKYYKNIQFSLSVENLFDEEYFEYSIGRERSYFAEVKIDW
jgi:iron complex outermembrane receptor protein